MSITTKFSIAIGDVFLATYAGVDKLMILDVVDGYIQHQFGWDKVDTFMDREPVRYGYWIKTWYGRRKVVKGAKP